MTDAPRDGSGADSGEQIPARPAASYPPPYGGTSQVGDDELASALAAQAAMYTGPITIPVANSDPAFRPDPTQLDPELPPPPGVDLPPVPVQTMPSPPEYVAPDAVASDPEARAFVAPEFSPAPFVAPAFEPLTFEPPTFDAAGSAPPVADAPAYEPPVFAPPADEPPVFEAPAFEAPAFEAPAFEAPAYEPPVFDASAYAPPAYEPPAFDPPAFEPPAFEPPAFEPLSFEPLAFDPPAFDPSASAGPVPASDAEIFGELNPHEPPPADPYGPPPQWSQLDSSQLPPEPAVASADPASDPDAGAGDSAPHPSTLDAILQLEDELRRMQAPTPGTGIDENTLDAQLRAATPPVAGAAQFGTPPPTAAPVTPPAADSTPAAYLPSVPPADVPNAAPSSDAVPGWVPAPDPATEGVAPGGSSAPIFDTTDAPTPPVVATDSGRASVQPWLSAPPPAFAPPALVEPPPLGEAGFDPALFTPEPVSDQAPPLPSGIDVTTLPPPGATPPRPVSIPAGFAPSDFFGAPAASEAAPVLDPDVEGIDEIDRADLAAAIPVDAAGAAEVLPAPVGVAAASTGPSDLEPRDPHPFALERAAAAPTPVEQRAGRAARMFWLWFAANSSFLAVAVGATMLTMGMSLRQALVATLLGVVLSTIPLGLGTRAGKWSGQPTVVVSRATFGHVGNVLPALLAVLSRAFWGGVLLWLLVVSIVPFITNDRTGGLGIEVLVALGVGVVVAATIAVVGFGLLYRVQRILGILSIVLVGAMIALTVDEFDATVILQTAESSWIAALGGAVLVFSVVGLAWAHSSSDLARYQRPGSSTGATSVWSVLGTALPALAIISWGAILAASQPHIAEGLARDPLTTLVELVPSWFAIPLMGAAGFGLVAAAILTIYSGGLAIVSAGIRMPRAIATIVAAILVGGVGFMLLAWGADARDVVQDLATTLAVPVAAWVGLFGGEMMVRTRRFDSASLTQRGGVYPAVRWVNLLALLVLTAVGWGFTTASLAGLDWQGYLFAALGVAADSPWVATDAGVLVALGVGLLVPIIVGIPAVRRQERQRETSRTGGMPVVEALVD